MNKTKKSSSKYKTLIMERLSSQTPAQSKKEHYHIHNLKTQCTPNDLTQDEGEKVIDDFDSCFKVQYQPVILGQKPKHLGRCLYPELIALTKSSCISTKPKSKCKSKERLLTQEV